MYRVFDVLKEDGRSLTWLAQKVPINRNYLYQIKMGRRRPPPWLRKRCVEMFAMSEEELFAPSESEVVDAAS